VEPLRAPGSGAGAPGSGKDVGRYGAAKTFYSVVMGTSSRTVHCGLCAGPIFHSCPYLAGVVRRHGSSFGSSRRLTELITGRSPFRRGGQPTASGPKASAKTGECPGPRESTADRLSRPDRPLGYLGVQDCPFGSTTIVSTALAGGP
jgi:hypothetical protein